MLWTTKNPIIHNLSPSNFPQNWSPQQIVLTGYQQQLGEVITILWLVTRLRIRAAGFYARANTQPLIRTQIVSWFKYFKNISVRFYPVR